MQAISQGLSRLIDGRVQYVIPVFQRDYSWTEEQCAQLWQDVVAIASAPPQARHFVGSIVYTSTHDTGAALPRWLLIDGQQRLTTVMLIVAALRDHLSETGYHDTYLTSSTLDTQFLRNAELPPANRPKLVLRRHDHATLHALLDGTELPKQASERICENYEYFKSCVPDVDPKTLYAGINRLEVVDVTLQSQDDPQSIFESLNSTGLDLSPSDLIRNFILMRLSEPEQTRLYEQIWYKIEVLFRGHEDRSDTFARDYVALKTQATKQGRADEIYHTFRRSFGSFCEEAGGLEEALLELQRYAEYYAAFNLGRGNPDSKLVLPLRQLRRLIDVPAILVMRLFDCHGRVGTLPVPDFVEALTLLESYVFRRAICGLQTRGYWSVFASMAHQIDEKRPLESLKVGLARQSDNYRFPHDGEFRPHLERQDVYGKRVCRILLERLENHDTKEPTDTGKYSIEHIMPQNERLPLAWRKMLGPGWKEIREEWLHRLGNLTLTAYNSEYSDRPFEEKKTIQGGFEDSAVRLNKFVRTQDVWTAVEMRTRGAELSERALKIWSRLEVSPALLEEAEHADLLRRAELGSVENVKMDQHARGLFNELSVQIKEMEPAVVELAEGRSISYHAGGFFVEVLPRRHSLLLRLAPDVNEIDDPNGIAQDATQRKFLVGSKYDGGVAASVRVGTDVRRVIPLVRQALELVGR